MAAAAQGKRRKRAWVSCEGRLEVLHEVHLVHVAARDRRPDVCWPRPFFTLTRLLPARSQQALAAIRHEPSVPQSACGKRERGTRLRRSRHVRTPDRLREAVAEVDVRNEVVPARREEPVLGEPRLDARKRAVHLADLEPRVGLSVLRHEPDELAVRRGRIVAPENRAPRDEEIRRPARAARAVSRLTPPSTCTHLEGKSERSCATARATPA